MWMCVCCRRQLWNFSMCQRHKHHHRRNVLCVWLVYVCEWVLWKQEGTITRATVTLWDELTAFAVAQTFSIFDLKCTHIIWCEHTYKNTVKQNAQHQSSTVTTTASETIIIVNKERNYTSIYVCCVLCCFFLRLIIVVVLCCVFCLRYVDLYYRKKHSDADKSVFVHVCFAFCSLVIYHLQINRVYLFHPTLARRSLVLSLFFIVFHFFVFSLFSIFAGFWSFAWFCVSLLYVCLSVSVSLFMLSRIFSSVTRNIPHENRVVFVQRWTWSENYWIFCCVLWLFFRFVFFFIPFGFLIFAKTDSEETKWGEKRFNSLVFRLFCQNRRFIIYFSLLFRKTKIPIQIKVWMKFYWDNNVIESNRKRVK